MNSSSKTYPRNTFLVGGAVRDELLGIDVTDRDWVVVGSSPDAMLNAGFKSVGKDFPVFLHPQTHEEYALARVERKTSSGYHGFAFDTDSSVTLEEDLSRRDLTINAIAKTVDDKFIDPYGGKQDLADKVLRHVSDAFVEDPVRVLRIARFMARFAHLGFTVAPDTMQLMHSMVDNGEVNNLVAERVWQEMHGALLARTPRAFFDTLSACGALTVVLPEVAALSGVPQKAEWHPEIDCYIHTMMVLEQSCQLSSRGHVRFAAICHDLGKATTPKDILPGHHGHENRGADITESFCKRLRVPNAARDLATLCARYHTHCHRVFELKDTTLVDTLRTLDVKRKPERFAEFVLVCEADARGRQGYENRDYSQANYIRNAAKVLNSVDTAAVANNTPVKSRIADSIRRAQLAAIRQWRTAL